MLILTRKPQQTIVVGDTTITVVSIRGGSVRIGIDAPKDVPVWREEVAPIRVPAPDSPPGSASTARGEDALWVRSDDLLSCN